MLHPQTIMQLHELFEKADKMQDDGFIQKTGKTPDGKPILIAIGVGKSATDLQHILDLCSQDDPRSTDWRPEGDEGHQHQELP